MLEYHIPKKVYMPQEAGSGVEDSLAVKLFDFQ